MSNPETPSNNSIPTSGRESPRDWTVSIIGGETHIGAITALNGKGLQIKGACVREDQISWAKDLFQTEVYTDAEEMLKACKPDIVGVANENDLKADAILRAFRHGCHVIADKPAAITIAELDAIERERQDHDRRLLMLLTLRGHAQYCKLRELVSSGAIGEPIQCQAKMSVELKPDARPPWFLDQRRSGGPIVDLAIHSIDAVEWATGLRFTQVTAYQAHRTHPEMSELIDCGGALFKMSNGGTAFIQYNRVLPKGCGNDYRLDIVGTDGQIEFRLGKYLRVQKEGNVIEDFPLTDLPPNQSVVEDWLESLRNPSVSPLVPESASMRANFISCLAQNSADNGNTLNIDD